MSNDLDTPPPISWVVDPPIKGADSRPHGRGLDPGCGGVTTAVIALIVVLNPNGQALKDANSNDDGGQPTPAGG